MTPIYSYASILQPQAYCSPPRSIDRFGRHYASIGPEKITKPPNIDARHFMKPPFSAD